MPHHSLHLSTIQQTLRELVDAQEAYFAEHVAYSASLDALGYKAAPEIRVALTGTDHAWSATAVHSDLPQVQCSITVGRERLAA